MTTEVFKPLDHKWKIDRLYRPGMRHPTRIEKSCSACKVSGRKSFLEGIGPCPGVPHDPECLRHFGHMRMGESAHFECQCGANKDHEKKKPWKVEECIHCHRPRSETHLTRCAKSGNDWHTFKLRKNS